ncbi:hypothetical protein LDZ77_04410 [Bacteroides xylanisolvens]|uniref:DNA pilot protein n=1 Tax=Bacteroides xylanisolvens TaxID=371601 RepID=A0AAW4SRE0_9BACE|nr:hypothetical protein [Bacteroides xylanisolvens]MCA4531294.1 hypothetical protein [Bacteroides xylanisolvens]MCA4549380.1 hypothetical protein [Bacteroides xylanisolvens]MCA4562982.1 hypothetical protein [Bacteroides xylanisolvens]MCA4568076.1 hypothetical protein [Bacteroides xylanisolvens]MCA4598618.1 hypothetical protein [Bacteroides xylanisolvens]
MASAALIGGALAAVGSVGASVMSNKSNSSIAQSSNEFNEKMLDKQMAYNTKMYNQQLGDQWNFYNDAKQNAWDVAEYNSAPAQRQRLEAAGLNPYLMMSGGTAGAAQSSGAATSPSAQGVTPPTSAPYTADYSGIAQALGDMVDRIQSEPDRNKIRAETDNLRIEGKYKAAEAIARIANIKASTHTMKGRLALDKLIYSIDKDLKSSQMAVNSQNIANMRAEEKFKNVQTLMADKQLSFMDANQKMYLAQKAADIQLRLAQGKLTRNQAEHEIKKMAETEVRTSLGVEQITSQQLSNQAQRQENRFNADTYKTRVKTLEETLFNLIHDTDKIGIFNTGSKILRSVGAID